MIARADSILPKASEIDYSNIRDVEGYSIYLIKLYEQGGGFKYPHRITPQLRAIEKELLVWCSTVKEMLMDAALTHIPTLINSYGITYRVAHGEAPSESFMRKVRINAVCRRANGDKSISSSDVAKILRDEIYSPNFKTLDSKYGLYYFGLINEWVKELQCSGTFSGITSAEAYIRLRLLMTEDLFGEYGSKGANRDKRKWAIAHKVNDLTSLDTSTLREYISFALSVTSMSGKSMTDQLSEYITLFAELDSRKDLSPYYHAALKIDLALKEEAIKDVG